MGRERERENEDDAEYDGRDTGIIIKETVPGEEEGGIDKNVKETREKLTII